MFKIFFKKVRKKIRNILPKSLLARAVTIVAAPLILLQSIILFIFLDRHMEVTLKLLADDIAGEAAFITQMIEDGIPLRSAQKTAFYDFKFQIRLDRKIKKLKYEGMKKSTWLYGFLEKSFSKKVERPYYVRMSNGKIYIDIISSKGLLKMEVSKKRLFSKTTPLVVVLIVLSTIMILLIVFIFIRNQVRPIKILAEVAEMFGRGDVSIKFTPSGATEVRKAGKAFLVMRNRISVHIKERFDMLACISHDLRTPITRFKLQLACMEQCEEIDALKKDVKQMQDMLEAFMVYAKSQHGEVSLPTEMHFFLSEIIGEILNEAKSAIHGKITNNKIINKAQFSKNDFKITLDCPQDIATTIKRGQFARCINNILTNAQKFATCAHICVYVRVCSEGQTPNDELVIKITDNGPGIPKEERENVFKPFYRIDESRNLDCFSGVGLGMSIAKDIVSSHGGKINLKESKEIVGCINRTGGLVVEIRIPK